MLFLSAFIFSHFSGINIDKVSLVSGTCLILFLMYHLFYNIFYCVQCFKYILTTIDPPYMGFLVYLGPILTYFFLYV